MVTVTLSGNLRRFADYQREVCVDAETVERALEELVERFPELRRVLLDGDGAVRQVHRFSVNDQLIKSDDLTYRLNGSDQLFIITALAGG